MRNTRLLLAQRCAALLTLALATACSNEPAQMGGPSIGASGVGAMPSATAGTPAAMPPAGGAGTGSGTTTAAAGTNGGTAGVAPVVSGGTGAAGTKAAAGGSGAAGTGTAASGSGGSAAAGTGSATAGTGAPVGGAGGEGVAGMAGGPAATGPKPQCLMKDSQMVVLGDSYVDWPSHSFLQDLAKETGHKFRSYAVGGVSMATGGIDSSNNVPQQYAKAVRADKDIRFMLLDGGGNDILVADTLMFPRGAECKESGSPESNPDCKKILDLAVDAATKLMMQAANDGVRDVLYFYYPDVPKGTLLGGADPVAVLNYARPGAKASCDNAEMMSAGKLRCHWVELTDVFKGHADWFALADIHPTPEGSAAMAKKMNEVMKAGCLAQPESSGCCEP